MFKHIFNLITQILKNHILKYVTLQKNEVTLCDTDLSKRE